MTANSRIKARLARLSLPGVDPVSYAIIRDIVHERSGIKLPKSKWALIWNRLNRRIRTLGYSTIRDYCTEALEGEGSYAERDLLVDLISTNVTRFFREPHHFEYLSRELIPGMGANSPIRILSAGCSTGEEPYSIAIALLGSGGSKPRPESRVDAVDISTRVLRTAARGLYSLDRLTGLSKGQIEAFFLRGVGVCQGWAKVAPAVQNMVKFQRLSLLNATLGTGRYAVIFCRNVSIYFEKAEQENLRRQLHQALVPGGTLFVGHAEGLVWSSKEFEYVRPSIYRKRAT